MLLLLLTICCADQIFIISSSLYDLANHTSLSYTPPPECGTPLSNAKKISMRMHYYLGRTIASQYDFNYHIAPSNSTNHSLDIMSLYSVLMGLYTPGTGYFSTKNAYPYVENLTVIAEELNQCKDRVLPYYSRVFSFATYIDDGSNYTCNNSNLLINNYIKAQLNSSTLITQCLEMLTGSSNAQNFIGAYQAYLSLATSNNKETQINCNPSNNFTYFCKKELFNLFNDTFLNFTNNNLTLVHYSYPLANYTADILSSKTISTSDLFIRVAIVPQMQLITFLKYVLNYDINITEEGIPPTYLIFKTYLKNSTIFANISINEKQIVDFQGNAEFNLTKFLSENITQKYKYEYYLNECAAVAEKKDDPNNNNSMNIISTIIEVSLLVLIVIFCMVFQRAKSNDESNMAEEKKLDEKQLKEIEQLKASTKL